jgi:Zn-dependent peptidase ImmA (M78 family)
MDNKDFNEFLKTLLQPISDADVICEGLSLKMLFEKRMAELDLSQNQVEKLLNIERKSLDGILDRTAKRVDIVNVLKLGSFLNLPPEKLLSIYLTEMPSDTIGDLEKARKAIFIVSHFDLANLFKVKFINSKTDFEYIENKINSFFSLESIYQYNDIQLFPAFSRTKRASNNRMREFWIKSAHTFFKSINNPNDFDRSALVELIPKIRPYTMNVEKGLLVVAQALYHVGVTVIFQPSLPTVQARGATFMVNEKPCIVLTDLNQNYPTVWFALLHELHHVLYDMEAIEKNNYHITGELDLLLINEDKANAFAREYLFSADRTKYIAPFIDNEHLIREYAKQSQVHPSFIYSFYNYDKSNQGYSNAWSRYKQYFPDLKQTLKNFKLAHWDQDIAESIKMIKETVFRNI